MKEELNEILGRGGWPPYKHSLDLVVSDTQPGVCVTLLCHCCLVLGGRASGGGGVGW